MFLERTDTRYPDYKHVCSNGADCRLIREDVQLSSAVRRKAGKGVLKLADFFVHTKVSQVVFLRIFPQSIEVLKHVYVNLCMSPLV